MDSVCRKCFHACVCDEFNADRDYPHKRCAYANDHFVYADRLGKLAAADRDGRVVVMPCKVGDMVYTVDLDCEDNPEHTEMCFCWNKSCKSCEKAYLRVWENRTKTVDIRSIVAEMGLCGEDGGFGKTVFLTRESAEAALKEQEAQKCLSD